MLNPQTFAWKVRASTACSLPTSTSEEKMKTPISKSQCGICSSLIAAGLLSVLLAACGGGGGYGGTPVQATMGSMSVSLTDAPSCGFDAVNITVTKVRVNQSASASENDAGWTDITLTPAQKINLLTLTNGTLLPLGQTPLAAGHYTQLRLVLDPNTGNGLANSVVLTGTSTEVSLDTPSAVQSGIKLVGEFDVAAGQRADVVLDFDACKSIVTKGNGKYGLKPVVKVVPSILNGIDGVCRGYGGCGYRVCQAEFRQRSQLCRGICQCRCRQRRLHAAKPAYGQPAASGIWRHFAVGL